MRSNIQILPIEFKGKIQECNKLIEDANKAMGKPDKNNVICPLIFSEDILSYDEAISEKIREIRIYMGPLKNGEASKKYEKVIERLELARAELRTFLITSRYKDNRVM